jgi:ubiquinone biosynthesis protein COQ4
MNILKQVKTAKTGVEFALAYLRLATEPGNTLRVFQMEEVMMQMLDDAGTSVKADLTGLLHQNPAIAAMLAERRLMPRFELEDLADCPPGSLGHAFYNHMRDNGLKPDFFPDLPQDSDIHFVEQRLRQTHDIWHVLTGFNTDVPGEVGLQAFYAAQIANPISISIMSAFVLHTIAHLSMIPPTLEALKAGYSAGQTAACIIPVRWEERWNVPLDDLRREYNITPASRISYN